jgi:hypothetical protein
MAHAFLEGIAAVHNLFWRFVGGEHVHALRSRERGCFLVVQTLWAEKIRSTTDAGSLNTFGRNEIEVAPISSALSSSIACLVILYKTCRVHRSRWGIKTGIEDSRSTTKRPTGRRWRAGRQRGSPCGRAHESCMRAGSRNENRRSRPRGPA